jgi:phage-related baseplate assembly protein
MSDALNFDDIKQFMTPDHIDLSALPPPKIIEELSFGDVLDSLISDFCTRNPAYTALLESDPVMIALECAAYREVLLRQRINEAAKATMLAYATGTDLDNVAAFYGVQRLDGEQDDRLRFRAQLALESLTTAGSEKAYLFHALSASPDVKSASVSSPEPGKILISVLPVEKDEEEDENLPELTDIVLEYVSSEDKRPLTDLVLVENAEIIEYEVNARVYLYFGPSMTITEDECRSSLDAYVAKCNKIGNTVARSGIFDALHAEGVRKVELTSPAQDIETTKRQAPNCTAINIEFIIANDDTTT